MGSLLWREGGTRLVIQWYDARGNREHETIRAQALDGTPLARRTLERDGRRRLAEHELEVDRQRAGLTPISSSATRTRGSRPTPTATSTSRTAPRRDERVPRSARGGRA